MDDRLMIAATPFSYDRYNTVTVGVHLSAVVIQSTHLKKSEKVIPFFFIFNCQKSRRAKLKMNILINI